MPHSGKMYVEGQEPFIVDLRKVREVATNIELTAAPMIVVHGYTSRVVEVTAPGTIDIRME